MASFVRALLSRFKQSKWLSLSAKLGLTLAAFWFVFRGIDVQHLGVIVAEQKKAGLVEAVLLIFTQITLGTLRWRLVLAALSQTGRHVLSALEALKLYYISVFFNCCLPGTVGGDVVRVWLAKSDRIPLSTSIHSVIIDRLIALVALAILVAITLPWLGAAAGFGVNTLYLLPLMIAAIAAAWWCLKHAELALAPYQHIRPARWLSHFVQCLRMLFSYPATSIVSLLYAILSHLSFCLCAYVLARSLAIDITLWQCITLIPLVMLVTTLPISIGGWGVREASMVGMLGLIGVPQAAALMVSLEIGALAILTSLPAALLWLAFRRKASEISREIPVSSIDAR